MHGVNDDELPAMPGNEPISTEQARLCENAVELARQSIDCQPAQPRQRVKRRKRRPRRHLGELSGLGASGPDYTSTASPDPAILQGQVVPDAVEFPPSTHLGRFRVIRELGRGGFGVVLLAFDPRLKREVALKLPLLTNFADVNWRKRIIREARAAASLDHPGILPVLETGSVGPVRYIASAYCAGPDLRQWLTVQKNVSLQDACQLIADLADAVYHAHCRGILHRDIKPANVLLKLHDAGRELIRPLPQLTDFGLSRPTVGRHDECGRGPVGTLAYMAPEVASGSTANGGVAADVYSLGAVLHELVSGRPPSAPLSESAPPTASNSPVDATWVRRNLPRDLAAIIEKALHVQPEARYSSAAALASDLRAFLNGRPVAARPVGKAEAMAKWSRRHPAYSGLCAALAISILGGLAGIIWQWRRAEAGLELARSQSARSNESRLQAEAAVMYMAQSLDEANLWRMPEDWRSDANVERLGRYHDRFMRQSFQADEPRPITAAARSYMARVALQSGDKTEGLRLFRESLKIWHELLNEDDRDQVVRDGVANTCLHFGAVLKNDFGVAMGHSLVEGGRLLGEFPLASDIGRVVAREYCHLLELRAASLHRGGRTADAEELESARSRLVGFFDAKGRGTSGFKKLAGDLEARMYRTSAHEADGPERAFDGDLSTHFNSRAFPPVWIEIDLQNQYEIQRVTLVPEGATMHAEHCVYVSNSPIGERHMDATLVQRFVGEANNAQRLNASFVPARGRYLQIRTVRSPEWVAWKEIEVYGYRPGQFKPRPALKASTAIHRKLREFGSSIGE